jgi:hypothetical protein
MFKQGDLAVHKLTGEVVMVLETLEDKASRWYLKGYWIRTPRYTVEKVADFELMERKLNE